MLLEIRDLQVYYEKAMALEEVSLSVAEGEVVSVIGANGAGKTTLLRTISGLKKPLSGELLFRGERLGSLAAHKVARIGIRQVPAGRMVFGPMTVLENLKIGAGGRRDRAQVKRDLERMYQHFPVLEEKRSQAAGSLSGGQQQMVAIARALMGGPSLLLMDEPCTGLSPIMVAEVAKIIREINKSGVSILLVEQNSRMALNVANRAYVLELGGVVMQGEATSLATDDRVQKHYLGGIEDEGGLLNTVNS